MATHRFSGVAIALTVVLLGLGIALFAGGRADAQAESSSSPSTTPSSGVPLMSLSVKSTKPLISVSLPGVSSPDTPSIGLSVPSIGVSVPGISVSVPSIGVSVPNISVSVPSVSVSAPGVGLSTPSVGVDTPSPPSTSPTETPATSSPPVTGSPPSSLPGGGASAPPSRPTSVTIENPGNSTATPVPDSAPPVTPSLTHGTTAVHEISVGDAGEEPQPTRASPGRTPHRQRHLAEHSIARTAATGGSAPAFAQPITQRAARASRATTHHTGNPLDTIGRHIPLPLPVPDWSKPIILLLLLLAIWFGARSHMAARRARRLEDQRTTLLRDVGAMQAALVPEVPAHLGGLVVSVAYRPAEGPAAGGDFYDLFTPEPGKVAIILGDVAGHGHQALTQAALTRYTLRAYIQAGLEPRAALALAGRVLADPTFEHFATVAVGVYLTSESKLTYASAGHPPPIMCGFQAYEPLEVCCSPPIGWGVPTGRRQTTLSLPAGSVVCFFSDGLIEARRDEELLGRERLSEILAELGTRPKAAELLQRVSAEATTTPDDMAACILVPETMGLTTHVHVEELEADTRALGANQVQRFLETCQVPAAGIAGAIEHASDIAATSGTALLQVERAATTAATVTVSGAGQPRAAPHVPSSQPRIASGKPKTPVIRG
jgi:Stage II sporulation protein E (SpoIIE)